MTMITLPRTTVFADAHIDMAHGAGGKASRRLIEGLFAPLLFGGSSEPLGDSAHFNVDDVSRLPAVLTSRGSVYSRVHVDPHPLHR